MRKKIKDVIKFSVALIASKIIKIFPLYRDIWIITERKSECKDNGAYLFKYIRKNYPTRKVFYAIEKKSNQKKRILQYGNVINFGSFKHYVYALAATKLIGAFLPCGIPDSICFYKFHKLVKGKKIFLQHGITKEMIPSLFCENSGLNLFVCGAKPEFDFVEKKFHYPKESVVYTGFCRFDGLLNYDVEKTILLMPTWRKWIPSATWMQDKKDINLNYYEYFITYKKLIYCKELRNMLKDNGYKLIFFLHHELQPFVDYFGKTDDVVSIANEQNYDVQDLLKTSSCLITDYSSVAFDFAYMGKPVIYYQFDEQEYYSKHYQRGYFNYDTMGFGVKCSDEDAVLDELSRLFDSGMRVNLRYKENMHKFFKYRDRNNCERVFKQIERLK